MELQAPKIYQKMREYCIFCFLCWPSQLLRYPQVWPLPELSCAEFSGKSALWPSPRMDGNVTSTVIRWSLAQRAPSCRTNHWSGWRTKPTLMIPQIVLSWNLGQEAMPTKQPKNRRHEAGLDPWKHAASCYVCSDLLFCSSFLQSFSMEKQHCKKQLSVMSCGKVHGSADGVELGRPKHHQTCQLFIPMIWNITFPIQNGTSSRSKDQTAARTPCIEIFGMFALLLPGGCCLICTVVVWTRSSNLQDISKSFQNQWYISLNYIICHIISSMVPSHQFDQYLTHALTMILWSLFARLELFCAPGKEAPNGGLVQDDGLIPAGFRRVFSSLESPFSSIGP